MPHDPYKALYVHIPYCAKKCAYCDFTSFVLPCNHREIDCYIDELVEELNSLSKKGELDHIKTVYIGGGTPTYIGSARLSKLLNALSLLQHCGEQIECSVEANPESINSTLVSGIKALGVNRLSIGVQSFDDKVLALLGRVHDAKAALEAIACAKEHFKNINIDIMCGIPGQNKQQLKNTILRVIELDIPHVSVYPLSINPHTSFSKMLFRGLIKHPSEDMQADHMELAAYYLQQAGYKRYEVANYAKDGFECKHNMAYWSSYPYLGLGLSAVTMTQNSQHRMRKKDNLIIDDLNQKEMIAEDIMLAMRMSNGITDERISAAETTYLPGLRDCFDNMVSLGLVSKNGSHYVPTERGWLCGNELFLRIFNLASQK